MAFISNIFGCLYCFGLDIYNAFVPIKYLTMGQNSFIDFNNINHFVNVVFWIFIVFAIGYSLFSKYFRLFLRKFKIDYCKHNLAIRAVWNLAYFGASVSFLTLYHKYMISPELIDDTGRLFPKFENTIFYKSQHCDNFEIYSLIIVTFFLHSAMQDFREFDFNGCVSKVLYSFALISLQTSRFQNYFVLLNINLGVCYFLTECLTLISLPSLDKNSFASNTFLCLRILLWSHMYVNLLPFNYLVPTLFAKNFNLFLNIFIWFWYGMCIWNSPVLQYFYHQIYHNAQSDCIGYGSAARCILLKDGPDQQHYEALKAAYNEIQKEYKIDECKCPERNASARAFQAIRGVMMVKRKLRRMRNT